MCRLKPRATYIEHPVPRKRCPIVEVPNKKKVHTGSTTQLESATGIISATKMFYQGDVITMSMLSPEYSLASWLKTGTTLIKMGVHHG